MFSYYFGAFNDRQTHTWFNYNFAYTLFHEQKKKIGNTEKKTPTDFFQCAQCCEIFWMHNKNKICVTFCPSGLLISDMAAKFLRNITVHKTKISCNYNDMFSKQLGIAGIYNL